MDIHNSGLKILGRGSHGTVYMSILNKKLLACKMILCDNEYSNSLLFEMVILKMVKNHSSFIQFYPKLSFITNYNAYIYMEYADMNLFQYINGVTASERLIHLNKLIKTLSLGIDYLYSKSIYHLDIKPSNVLVLLNKKKLKFKIIDFGSADLITSDLSLRNCYSPPYRPPEFFFQNILDLPYPVDIWATGITIIEYIIGKRVFLGITEIDIYNEYSKILSYDYLPIDQLKHFKQYNKIKEMVHLDYRKRKLPFRNFRFSHLKKTIHIDLDERLVHLGKKYDLHDNTLLMAQDLYNRCRDPDISYLWGSLKIAITMSETNYYTLPPEWKFGEQKVISKLNWNLINSKIFTRKK